MLLCQSRQVPIKSKRMAFIWGLELVVDGAIGVCVFALPAAVLWVVLIRQCSRKSSFIYFWSTLIGYKEAQYVVNSLSGLPLKGWISDTFGYVGLAIKVGSAQLRCYGYAVFALLSFLMGREKARPEKEDMSSTKGSKTIRVGPVEGPSIRIMHTGVL